MNLLAIDTTTEQLSVAVSCLRDGRTQAWSETAAGGARASDTLIGIVRDMLRQADLPLASLDALCVGCGPGAFTGLRTACAVAQGLAFGAGVPVLPVPSLLCMAEAARRQQAPCANRLLVTALLDARMDEVYMATYAWEAGRWHTRQAIELLAPQAVEDQLATLGAPEPNRMLVGNVFALYAERLGHGPMMPPDLPRVQLVPHAMPMLYLAPDLLAQGRAQTAAAALPLYVRDKVAQTSAERAAVLRARAASGRP